MRGMIQFAAFAVASLTVGNAWGDVIFVGSPTCPAPPGCPVYGNEVNGITGNTFTLDQASGPSTAVLTNPVLLMIGVPNVAGTFSAPTVTLSVGTGVLGGTAPTGLTWNSTTGFAGTMTAGGPITDAYQAVGLSDPASTAGNSESFANWSAADSAVLGLTATNFGVYVYELSNTGLLGHPSTDNVTFGSTLPTGTFVVAYGCSSSGWPTTTCGSGGTIYSTPFTQSGLAVPESPALLILGCDLLGVAVLVGVFRRRLAVGERWR